MRNIKGGLSPAPEKPLLQPLLYSKNHVFSLFQLELINFTSG